MHARLRGPNNLLIKPDFPCLADEIAEPCQDMNIKVVAVTVSVKSTNTCRIVEHFWLVYTNHGC